MQRFSHDGVGIAYIDVMPEARESAIPVLLIHGFASNHSVNWITPQWVRSLTQAGYRVIALDNRGHGKSDPRYDPADFHTHKMAGDAVALLDHLGISEAGVIGYSMGARISAFLTLANPTRVRALALGGLGIHLVDGVGLPMRIADAMEAPSLSDVTEPTARMFRAFAESTKSDLKSLAACIRGSRQTLTPADVRGIQTPTIVCVGTKDPIAGNPHDLVAMLPNGTAFDIEGRDHNLAVGDRSHRAAVVAFFDQYMK